MNTFPLISTRLISAVLLASLAVMLIISMRATFTEVSLVEENNVAGMPEPRGNMPPANAPSMPAPNSMGFALNDKQSDSVSQLMEKLRENPNDSKTLMELGDVFMTAEDWSRAQVFLKRAIVSAPGDVRPRFMTAVCEFRMGNPAGAAETFESLLDLKREPQAMYNLALLYKYHLQQPTKAKALFEEIIASTEAGVDLMIKTKQEMEK